MYLLLFLKKIKIKILAETMLIMGVYVTVGYSFYSSSN